MAATIGDLLRCLRVAQDEKDEINAAMKKISARIEEAETLLTVALRDSGQTKAADEQISVSLGKKWRAKYDPEKWESIIGALIGSGYGHVVQRRLTDTKVEEMFNNGVPLPDGLSLEAFDNLSTRRLNGAAK